MDNQGPWGGHVHTAIFKMDNQQGPTVGILLSVTWQPGWEWYLGENGLHVYVWVSPFAFHLKLSRHCWLAIPQYKIKVIKRNSIHEDLAHMTQSPLPKPSLNTIALGIRFSSCEFWEYTNIQTTMNYAPNDFLSRRKAPSSCTYYRLESLSTKQLHNLLTLWKQIYSHVWSRPLLASLGSYFEIWWNTLRPHL